VLDAGQLASTATRAKRRIDQNVGCDMKLHQCPHRSRQAATLLDTSAAVASALDESRQHTEAHIHAAVAKAVAGKRM
jgi:D-serine deaminase-like pyridoxal phosphate-dependent protein